MSEAARKTDDMRPFFEPALVAAGQHGVFHVTQVSLSPRGVRHRASAGRLHRLHAGVYSLVPRHLLKREGLWMAAVLACGEGAVLSHRSAAALLELRDWGGTKIDVTVPRRSRRKHAGIKVHCSTTLTDKDITEVNGIPCTTIARTLFDLGDVVTQRQLERSFDQADIIQAPLDVGAINDQLARNPTRPAAKAVRHVLETHYIGRTPTANENEEALLAITRSLGIPDPDCNAFVIVDDGGPPIKADFVWWDQRVIVETDSKRWHTSAQRLESDRVRDQRLMAAGWRIIRTTWKQMTQRPHELRPLLLTLLVPGSRAAHG